MAIAVYFITFLIGILSYFLWHWTYWMRRGIRGPRGYPVIGLANTMFSSDSPPFLRLKEWGNVYGPIFGITEGFNKSLVISDPDLVHEVFVKQYDNFYGRKLNAIHGDPEKDKRVTLFAAQGYRWKRLRTIASPTFSNGNLRKLKDTVEDCAIELLRHIEEQTAGGQQIDMLTFYQEFTLDVIGRISMGQTDSQMFKNPMLPHVRAIFGESRKGMFMMGAVAPTFTRLFRWTVQKFNLMSNNNPSAHILTVVSEAVEKRIRRRSEDVASGVDVGEPEDFIDLFLDARAENEQDLNGNGGDFSRSHSKVSKQLTSEEIVAQCFVFLVAGFDTTALSLAFTTYLLALNPQVMAKLQEEVDRECPDPEITFDQLAKLKYMEMVIKETLRLYPLAAPANSRRCMKDTIAGEYRIEAGTYVIVNTWAVQTDPSIWGADAESFRPERWEGSTEQHKSGGYIPFGLGPRQCIGMRLAYMEEKLLLAHLLRKYTFQPGARTRIPLKLVGRATTQPDSVWMHLRPRH
ncbi:unnamed protein product [Caenorhabditis sp. 36 PRJEB53466]|nr:unnamed protein product [Caenorhabditis sp. 36 PRJEB53466]